MGFKITTAKRHKNVAIDRSQTAIMTTTAPSMTSVAVVVAVALALSVVCGGAAAAAASYDWSGVDETLQTSIANKVFPGCVAAVATADGTVYLKSFGSLTYGKPAPHGPNAPTTENTRYDLARYKAITKAQQSTYCPPDLMFAHTRMCRPAYPPPPA